MRVVIVDDQLLMRRGLSMLLSTEDGIEVVGEACNGREALAVAATTRPDVVLTDAQMPVMGGVELVAELRHLHPDLPAIILTTFDDDDLVRRAIAAGAAGFLLKDSSIDDLVHAFRAVVDGGLVIDPRVARAALTRSSATPGGTGADTSPIAVLTRAERAVATEVATGATNGEIAAILVIAEEPRLGAAAQARSARPHGAGAPPGPLPRRSEDVGGVTARHGANLAPDDRTRAASGDVGHRELDSHSS